MVVIEITCVEGLRTDATAWGPVVLCKGCLRVVVQLYHAIPAPEHEDKYIWKQYKGSIYCKDSWRQKHCTWCGYEISHYDVKLKTTIATGVHFAIAQYVDTQVILLPWTWDTGHWEVKDFHLYETKLKESELS